MTPRSHPGSSASPGVEPGGRLLRVAIVGAASLKGKELKEVLETSGFPAAEVKLLDDDESLGQLEAVGDEATFIQSVLPEQFEHVDLAFFACEPGFTRQHAGTARKAGAAIVDLSYALEEEPGATVRAPWIEQEMGSDAVVARVIVPAHPVATVLALLLLRAQKVGKLHRVVATVFEPASERGRRGMDELHQQTVGLLSFQTLPREVFDSQVAFNLLSRYGEKATPALESVERRILTHFRAIARERAPVPSLVLLHAPTFHGYAFSLYVETEKPVSLDGVAQALVGPHVNVVPAPEEAPSNVSVAGQDQVQVMLRRESARENAFWMWAAADNLRVAAITAAECGTTLAHAERKSA